MESIKQIFNSIAAFARKTVRKFRISINRFHKAGGFDAFFKRTGEKIKKRDPRTLAVCSCALLVAIALPTIIITSSVNRRASAAAPEQNPLGAPQGSMIDLTNEYSITPPPTPASTPSPTPTLEPTPTPFLLVKGATGATIANIQERLMELGYMEYDEPTEYFGEITKGAVEAFQRRHGLNIDGYVGETTYDALMRADALQYMVTLGDEGDDVQELQKRLRELDYLSSATGYFGTDTAAAVKEFQKRNSLGVDGMIGMQTREMLYSEDAVAKSLSYGDKGDDVLKYQQRLYKLAYLTTEPDGTFGKDTIAAVKLFQELNGLIADGHIGPQTRSLLTSSNAQANALTIGMSGDTVKSVQKKLKELKYLDSADGYFGSGTETAVKAFQKRNSLTADGKVGRQTMTALLSGNAKVAASDTPVATNGPQSTSSPSSSGGSSSNINGASVESLISIAKSKLGSRYSLGAKGPSKFDCSGFVYWCLNQAGIKQGYMTSKTWRSVSKYQKISSVNDVKAGDILVFKMSSSSGHVGIAINSTEMIDASSGEGRVVQRSYKTDYWRKVFYCAYRIF